MTEKTMTLDVPIQRGDQTIHSIALRKPTAGDLRGVSISDVLQMQVTALVKVLPRISIPTLTEADVNKMDLADLTEAAGKLASFLLKKADREQFDSATA